jgi:3-hydroxyacyl-CoA dehydrogenase
MGLFELADLTGSPRVRQFADTYAGAVYRDRRLADDEYRRLRQMVRHGFKGDDT